MSLLPDPDTLLAVAHRITGHAGALRRHAQLLVASLGRTTWYGTAARAFAHEALEVCRSLRRAADRLDAAATLLREHAARVRAVLHELARDVRDLAGSAAQVGVDTLSAGRQAVGALSGAAGHVLHTVGI